MSILSVNSKKDDEVITYFEILLIFLIFTFILFLLYPKDRLKEQVLNEKSNFDLTAIYLKNMLRLEPQNLKLIFALAKSTYEQKNYYLSQKLLEVVEESSNDNLKIEAIKLNLQIQHTLLKKSKDRKKREKIKEKIFLLLNKIANENIKDIKNRVFLYHVAIANDDKISALELIGKILTDNSIKNQIYWLKNCHYLAYELNDHKKDFQCLKELIIKDKKNSTKWIKALKILIKQDPSYKKKIKSLIQNQNITKIQKSKILLILNEYKESAQILIDLYKSTKNKDLFIKAIDTLLKGNLPNEASLFAKKYEKDFLDDEKIVKKILKVYLLASKPQYAKELSFKLLQKMEEK